MTALPHDLTRPVMGLGPLRSTKVRAASREPRLAKVVRLRPVAEMSTRTFLVVVATLLSLSLVTMLALNTLLAQGSFERYDLVSRKAELVITEQSLSQELTRLESPQALEKKAREMGMVVNPNPAFIDLTTGQVVGVPVTAQKPDPAVLAATTGQRAGAATSGPGGEVALGLRVAEVPQ